MEHDSKILLVEGARSFGIDLDERAKEAFEIYLGELLKWNRKINLTAIRTEKQIVLKHFLDSLSVMPHLPTKTNLLDIGSGAGFPGIPLRIAGPCLEVTLLDSVRKKVDFQRHLVRSLGLKGIEPIHGRVQDGEILRRMAGRFDLVISRAFSDLHIFLALSAPFLGQGGTAIAMKGELKKEEIGQLDEVERIGFHLEKRFEFVLPFSTLQRSILLFQPI